MQSIPLSGQYGKRVRSTGRRLWTLTANQSAHTKTIERRSKEDATTIVQTLLPTHLWAAPLPVVNALRAARPHPAAAAGAFDAIASVIAAAVVPSGTVGEDGLLPASVIPLGPVTVLLRSPPPPPLPTPPPSLAVCVGKKTDAWHGTRWSECGRACGFRKFRGISLPSACGVDLFWIRAAGVGRPVPAPLFNPTWLFHFLASPSEDRGEG